MKVYSSPVEWTPTYWSTGKFDLEKMRKDEAEHTKKLVEHLRSIGYTGKHTGEIFSTPHADGYASYMLADGRKSCLIHLPYGDAWHDPNVEFLPNKEVLRRIEAAKKLSEIFAKKNVA